MHEDEIYDRKGKTCLTRDRNTHDMTSQTSIACYRWMNLSNKKLCSRLEDDRVDEDNDMMRESCAL